MCEGHAKILVRSTYRPNILENPTYAAKVATLLKFFNVEKI